MAVRRFDAVDDVLQVGPGAAALTGAYSVAHVLKFEGGNAAWHTPLGFITSGGLYRAALVRDTSNHYRIDHHQGSPSFRDTTETFVILDGWHLFIVTQAAGTATPRFHWFQEADGAMVHADAGGTLGHPLTASGGSIRFGAFPGGDPLNALLARAAVWDGVALTDGDCEALAGGNMDDWAAVTGIAHLWEFNQALTATAVEDYIGSADQTALTGTAVVTTDDPPTDIIVLGVGGGAEEIFGAAAATFTFGATVAAKADTKGAAAATFTVGFVTAAKKDAKAGQILLPLAVAIATDAVKDAKAASSTPITVGIATAGATAAVYYVDPDTGSDSDDGLSETDAWQTIAKVNGFTFVPGDTILFKRGSVWREKLTLNTARHQGTEASPILFGAFGAGDLPRITGMDVRTGFTVAAGSRYTVALTTNPGDYVLEDGVPLLKVASTAAVEATAGSFFWASDVLHVHSSDGADPDTHTIETVSTREAAQTAQCDDIAFENIRFDGGNSILVSTDGSTRCVFSGCEFAYSKFALTWQWEGSAKQDGQQFLNCHFEGAVTGQQVLCDNFVSSGNTYYRIHCGLELFDETAKHCLNFLIEDNDFVECGRNIFGATVGAVNAGILLDGDTNGTNSDHHQGSILGNTFKDCDSRAIDGFYGDSIVAHNLIDTLTNSTQSVGIEVNGPNNLVAHNTLVEVENIGIMLNDDPIDPDQASIVRNNIVYGATTWHAWSSVRGVTDTWSNNLYYKPGSTPAFNKDAAARNFAQWQSDVGEADSLVDDPLFTDAGTDDFTLGSGSPAIDAGIAIAGINDGYIGAAPDIGFAEVTVIVGAVTAEFTFGAAVAGKTVAQAATSLELTASIATTAARTAIGAAALPVTFTVASAAAKNAHAAASLPITLGVDTAAKKTAYATLALPIVFEVVSNGETAGSVSGAVSFTATFGSTTSATKDAHAAAALPVAFTAVTVGTRDAHGSLGLPITFTVVSDGDVGTPAVTGAASLTTTFGATVAGGRDAHGASSTTITFDPAVAGHLSGYGSATLPIIFGVTVTAEGDLLTPIAAGAIEHPETGTLISVAATTGTIARATEGTI